jgi:hypothetical protein
MSDILRREPWPFDWSPPAKARMSVIEAFVNLDAFTEGLRGALVALAAMKQLAEQLAPEPCDDPECVSSGRAVLCDIHGEEYDRADR